MHQEFGQLVVEGAFQPMSEKAGISNIAYHRHTGLGKWTLYKDAGHFHPFSMFFSMATYVGLIPFARNRRSAHCAFNFKSFLAQTDFQHGHPARLGESYV